MYKNLDFIFESFFYHGNKSKNCISLSGFKLNINPYEQSYSLVDESSNKEIFFYDKLSDSMFIEKDEILSSICEIIVSDLSYEGKMNV